MSKKSTEIVKADFISPRPKGLRSYSGIDCSGKTRVLPPTFKGIKALVKQVGEANARSMFPLSDPHESPDDEPKDIVRDFLQEYQLADKVERQTLINEFNSYIDSLEVNSTQDSPAGAPTSAQALPNEGGSDKEGVAQQEPTAEE